MLLSRDEVQWSVVVSGLGQTMRTLTAQGQWFRQLRSVFLARKAVSLQHRTGWCKYNLPQRDMSVWQRLPYKLNMSHCFLKNSQTRKMSLQKPMNQTFCFCFSGCRRANRRLTLVRRAHSSDGVLRTRLIICFSLAPRVFVHVSILVEFSHECIFCAFWLGICFCPCNRQKSCFVGTKSLRKGCFFAPVNLLVWSCEILFGIRSRLNLHCF